MKPWKKANPKLVVSTRIKPLRQSWWSKLKNRFRGKNPRVVIVDEMHEYKMGGMS